MIFLRYSFSRCFSSKNLSTSSCDSGLGGLDFVSIMEFAKALSLGDLLIGDYDSLEGLPTRTG